MKGEKEQKHDIKQSNSFLAQAEMTTKNAPLLKVCGMRSPENILEVAALAPDFMGFIFWPKSKRYVSGALPVISSSIKKIGVVVNQTIEEIEALIAKHHLQGIQLHGQESPAFCATLRAAFEQKFKSKGPYQESSTTQKLTKSIDFIEHNSLPTKLVIAKDNSAQKRLLIIKAFSVGDHFDFSVLKAYEPFCDYFLFDTKGKLPGGNGYTFSWALLKNYPSNTPYFLSGGIGVATLEKLGHFLQDPAAKNCAVIDVNSTFEDANFKKDPKALSLFKTKLNNPFINKDKPKL